MSPEAQWLLEGYCRGGFPMADEFGQLQIYQCEPRSVYRFEHFHIPQRIGRLWRKAPFKLHINRAFDQVVAGCRKNRSEWISDELTELYQELHQHGHAHSFEAWDKDGLAGGVYGTQVGGAFMAESMFHRVSGASNIALVFTIEQLQRSNFLFCDIQYANSHTARFNPQEYSHSEFMKLLNQALLKNPTLQAPCVN
jgi:leucyl/phenylalanyl-tRNA--protein transferase